MGYFPAHSDSETTGVQHLHLGNTQVSDSGLSHLRGLTNLSWLALNDTQVTDAGLAHLHGLPRLQWLWLNGTDVTETRRPVSGCLAFNLTVARRRRSAVRTKNPASRS